MDRQGSRYVLLVRAETRLLDLSHGLGQRQLALRDSGAAPLLALCVPEPRSRPGVASPRCRFPFPGGLTRQTGGGRTPRRSPPPPPRGRLRGARVLPVGATGDRCGAARGAGPRRRMIRSATPEFAQSARYSKAPKNDANGAHLRCAPHPCRESHQIWSGWAHVRFPPKQVLPEGSFSRGQHGVEQTGYSIIPSDHILR